MTSESSTIIYTSCFFLYSIKFFLQSFFSSLLKSYLMKFFFYANVSVPIPEWQESPKTEHGRSYEVVRSLGNRAQEVETLHRLNGAQRGAQQLRRTLNTLKEKNTLKNLKLMLGPTLFSFPLKHVMDFSILLLWFETKQN